jgi:hypothetical protein
MSTMSDSERSMLERPASSDYKKLRKECPKSTPTRRTDWRDLDNGDADDGWSVTTAAESNLDTRLVPE